MRRLATLLVLTVMAFPLAACATPSPKVTEKQAVAQRPVVETLAIEKEELFEVEEDSNLRRSQMTPSSQMMEPSRKEV